MFNMNSCSALIKSYLKGIEEKISKRIKSYQSKISEKQIETVLIEILGCEKCGQQHYSQIEVSQKNENKQLIQIALKREEQILSHQQDINFLKKTIRIQNDLTYSFFKNLMKEKNKENIKTIKSSRIQKNTNPFRLLISQCQNNENDSDDKYQNIELNSPFSNMKESREITRSMSRNRKCGTSRTKLTNSRYQSSEFALEMQQDDKEITKALKKLTKLQKYIFQKQNIASKNNSKIWNIGISPTKQRYKEENKNLKAIQTNLHTHIQILQKFRQIPSIESLVAREENLRKKEKNLKIKQEKFEKQELQLNKKHCQFLRKQKWEKIV